MYKITYVSRKKSQMVHVTLPTTLSYVQNRPRPIFSVSIKSHVILYMCEALRVLAQQQQQQ